MEDDLELSAIVRIIRPKYELTVPSPRFDQIPSLDVHSLMLIWEDGKYGENPLRALSPASFCACEEPSVLISL